MTHVENTRPDREDTVSTGGAEVERLRARVAELEAQLAGAPPRRRPAKQPRRSPWWAVSSAVLITLACVLAPLSVVAVWASTQISDTEQYVRTVEPLAHDPGVQRAIANEVTTAIFENLDVKGFTADALTTLAAQPNVPPRVAAALPGLAAPITNGVQSFTRTQVDTFLASPAFATLWDQVNRVAHEQVVALLEGTRGGALSAQNDTITLNLAPIIARVKQRLTAQGFGLASRIPTVDKSFVLVQSEGITRAQGFYRLLRTLGTWLPFTALVLFAGGVALARDRRQTVLKGSLGVTGAMLVLGVGLALLRLWYVDSTPGNVLDAQAAGDVFDTLVRFLRSAMRSVAVLGIVVALAAFLTGPSAPAARTRSMLEHGIGSLRGGAESAGFDTGRVGTWIDAHKRMLRIAALVAGGLVLTFWTRPTAWVVALTALAVVLVLAVMEFLGRPPDQVPARVPAGAAVAGPAPQTESAVALPAPALPRQTSRSDQGHGPDESHHAAAPITASSGSPSDAGRDPAP